MARANGFGRPLHPLQLVSWLALLLFFASFHLLALPVLLHHRLLPLLVALCWLLVSSLFALVYVCCRRDPSSPPPTSAVNPLPPAELSRECRWCAAVCWADTHHCRLCDKCVPGFDHHCLWLNTCIGRANYRHFVAALSAATAFLAFDAAVLAYSLHALGESTGWQSAVSAVYGAAGSSAGGQTALRALLVLSLCLHVCALLPVAHLLSLHVWLSYHRLSTYAWILQSRAREAGVRKAAAEPAEKGHTAVDIQLATTPPRPTDGGAVIVVTAADDMRQTVAPPQ